MLRVSQDYLNAVNHYTRNIVSRVYFNGSHIPLVDEIISVSIKEVGQSADSISFGDLCTNEATVKFRMSDSIPLENGYFTVEHGLLVNEEYVYIPMGTYYISDIECIGTQYSVTGYDSSTRLNVEYKPTVELPCRLEDIVKDICHQCHVTLDNTYVFSDVVIDTIYEGNCKETLCYMASLMGKNIKMNRNNELTFYWYNDCSYVIDKNIQHMNGYTRNTEEDIIISSLTSGSEENVLVSGNGRGITFDNPYMTQDILDYLLNLVAGFTYTPATIVYRGNPALEIGDIVRVVDDDGIYKLCIISEHEFNLTGMKGIIVSKGNTDVETVISSYSPTEVKLKKMYKVLQNAFKESTDTIIGANGGYFVIDFDGDYPSGFRIMDTPTLTDNTKLWIFNKNGLGYSEDGGKTLKNIAIDMFGHINANVINTGVLVGEYFELNLNDGSLIMGKRDEDGEFKNIWLEVNESGLTIGGAKEVREAVIKVETLYALGDSATEAPTTGDWIYPAPKWKNGKYMWQKTVTTRNSGEVEESVPTCISDAIGESIISYAIESSLGYSFSEYSEEITTLTAHIYIEDDEYDEDGVLYYRWYYEDGRSFGVGKTLEIEVNELGNHSVYFTAEEYDGSASSVLGKGILG